MVRSNPSHKPTSKPLVFFGTADFSARILKGLLENGHDIALVITKPDQPGRRKQQLRPPMVKKLAQSYGIPLFQPAGRGELSQLNQNLQDFQWGVVASYGMIIPESVLECFGGGLINLHPSLLPRWRGPSPIESAILHGDAKSGNTLIKLTALMDAGPVYARSEVELKHDITRTELYELLAEDGSTLLNEQLASIINGDLLPREQDESQAVYSQLLHKSHGWIDWQQPATLLERRIRAYLGWPGNRTYVNNIIIDVEASRIINRSGTPGNHEVISNELLIYAGDQALCIDQLKPAGRNSMSGVEFVRGYL